MPKTNKIIEKEIKFVLIKSRAWGGGEIGQRQSKHYKLPIIR